MPISSSGPTGPRPLTSPTTPATDEAAPASAPATASTGWAAGAGTATERRSDDFGGTRSSSPNLPSLGSPTGPVATVPSPVQQQVFSAVDRFTAKVQAQLHHDALSLARGQKPVREGDELSAAQQQALTSATTDLVKDIPIGALSPEVAASVQQQLKDAGVEVRDIASTRLGDLGAVGGDIAKSLVKNLKASSPTAYYSLAAGLAAAAGYTAWNGGSKKLSQLGIKPEYKQQFFDDQLSVKLGADWQSHFKDFGVSGTVEGKVKLGEGGLLTGSVSANSHTGFDQAAVGYQVSREHWNLSTNAAFDKSGFGSARVDTSYHDDQLTANAYATANKHGLETVGGRFTYNPSKDFSLSGGVEHNFQTDRTTANAEAAWKLSKDVDLAVSGRVDDRGESQVGVGVAIHF